MSPPLTPQQSARVEAHAALVHRLARQVYRSVKTLTVEELESAGNEALVEAVLRYDPDGAASFATFAHYRVRGAMIDALRRRTPGLRANQRALVRLQAAQAVLRQAAEDNDAQLRFASDRRTLEARVATARGLVRRTAMVMRMAQPDNAKLDRVADDRTDPELKAVRADRRTKLWAWIHELPPDDRQLIEAVYVHGRTMKEVAHELGTSNATISRRHARILDRLAERARTEEGHVG